MSNSSKKKNSEFDSPAGGPTPDWMRMAASETKGKSALSDENTPEWLKSIQSGQTSGKRPQPADDGMSDLERLLAEEGIDLGAVEEDTPEGSAGMSARDWLIQTSDDELVRNRKGRDEEIDLSLAMKPKTTPSTQAAPPPPPADDPFAGLSDLERLLMEEGIDMGGVKENRPQGSESMSAREWLIATSDDELVRKSGKDSTIPDLSTPATAKAKPATPAKAPTPPSAAETKPKPAAAPVQAAPPPPPADDPFAGLSDLERLLMEEGISVEAVKDERPTEAQGMSARDFLMSTSEDELIRKRVGRKEEVDLSLAAAPPKAQIPTPTEVEVDLPDWLAEDTPPTTAQGQPAVAEDDDLMIDSADLPDWLQDNAGSDTAAETTPAESPSLEEEELPDWLMEKDEPEDGAAVPPSTSGATEDDLMIDENDLPDWLQADADTSPDTPPQTPPPSEELPDWLLEKDDDEAVATKPSTPAASHGTSTDDDMMVSEADLPDWLQADETETPPAPAAANEELEDNELPDWLMGDDDDNTPPAPVTDTKATPASDEALDEEGLPDWLMGDDDDDTPPAPVTDTKATPASDDTLDEEGLPDWLMGDDDDAPEPPAPITTAKATPASDDTLDEEGLPDWLMGDDDDAPEPPAPVTTAKAVTPSDDVLDEEGLPDWLMGDDDDTSEPPAPVTTAKAITPSDDVLDEEGLPDWLMGGDDEDDNTPEPPAPVTAAKAVTPSDDVLDEEGLPDWLMGDDDDAPEPPAPVTTAKAVTPSDDVLDEEGLPDWLMGDNDDAPEPPAPVTTAKAVTPSDDVLDEEGLPDWLSEEEDTEESIAPVTSTSAQKVLDDDILDEEGLPDWLSEEEDSPHESGATSSVFTALEDEVAIPNDLPAWLREVSSEVNEPIVTSTPSLSKSEEEESEDLPDWLQDISEDDDSPIVVDEEEEIEPMIDAAAGEENDLPDWLREAKEADMVETVPAVAAVADTLLNENDVPDWLQEVKEEITTEPVVDDPYAGMSDLERMLAEEGIDVAGMADERPAESRGMSARDYLLATSDDELLRRKAGQTQAIDLSVAATPTKSQPVVQAEPVKPPVEVEPQVETPIEEEEVPAWLEAESSDHEEVEATSATMLDEDLGDSTDLPSWLQEAQANERPTHEDFSSLETEEASHIEPEPTPEIPSTPEPKFEPPIEVEAKVTPPAVVKPAPVIPHKPVTVYQGELPGWLRKLREADQRAQELIQLSPMYIPVPIPTTAPILVPQAVMTVAAMSQPSAVMPAAQPQTVTRVAPDSEATRQLEEARAAKNSGNLAQAFQVYQALVNRGTYLDAVISDLQEVVTHDPKNHHGYQLMGDAMVLDGRMQSALEAYHKGLAAL